MDQLHLRHDGSASGRPNHSSPCSSLHFIVLACRYRISDNVNLPFRVIPVIEEQGKTRVVMNIKAIANFSNQLFATNVTFKIPVSSGLDGHDLFRLVAVGAESP